MSLVLNGDSWVKSPLRISSFGHELRISIGDGT